MMDFAFVGSITVLVCNVFPLGGICMRPLSVERCARVAIYDGP